MKAERPICILIAALGGQGGGVLADWLVSAARIDGLEAQATSIPGVAQRTGATTYYFEVYPQRELKVRPVFSIFPASGAIDLMVSFEPMEAGRALSAGYISGGTSVITARERIFSTFEKIKPGDGITPVSPVFDALEKISKNLNIVEMSRAARIAKCHPNAVMFGAMAASGVLPMSMEICRESIASSNVAVEANLAGFDAGLELRDNSPKDVDAKPIEYKNAPDAFANAIIALPAPLQDIAGHAAARLLDYQNADYVELYLQRLKSVVAVDSNDQQYRLSSLVARRLAAWMAFEDIIRVAQLKTKPGRLKRIRDELGIGPNVPMRVHDYLKPGREELLGILPAFFGSKKPATSSRKTGSGIALKINTAGPFGWGMMRILSALKFWRPNSRRFVDEQAMIAKWLDAVKQAAAIDYELACNIADLATWARGYGEIRNRGFDQLRQVLENNGQSLVGDSNAYGKAVLASLAKASADPDNEFA